MRFSIYSELQCWPGKSTERLSAGVAEPVVHADRLGYCAACGCVVGNVSPLEQRASDEAPHAAGYGFYASGIMEEVAATPVDEMTEGDVVWVGTPQDVIERIEETIEVCVGKSEIAITVNLGGFERWKAIKTQEMFVDLVMPDFQSAPSTAQLELGAAR